MRKTSRLSIIGIILIIISAIPLFQMGRELLAQQGIDSRYTIEHVYEEQGFPAIINVQEIEVKGKQIEIIEESTGKKASVTTWDKEEGVEAGDIVKLHLLVDGKEVSKADEIWLSNRDRGSRYYSWLDVLRVNDKIAIVQRLTDDNTAMEKRKWKIIWIDENGNTDEEQISYSSRGDNLLAVRLIGFSGTGLMQMGYYSDILAGYPSIFFPILYPFITGLLGILLCVFALIRRKKKIN